ncbi:MAG: AmmeMemoRadiSam system protein B [Deltaproteobacteria bacterium]
MSSHSFRSAVLILFLMLSAGCRGVGASDVEKIRPAGVAGGFYPADPRELNKMTGEFLAKARVPALPGPLIAIVSPHAGYQYSGPVAAYSYALLRGHKFERVVVISPSHYESFRFSSVYDGDAYSTPLGKVAVDKAFAKQLVVASPLIKFAKQGHGEVQGRWEHALEDELPFLQRVLGEFKLVPVVMGQQDYETSRVLGVALARLIQKNASGDFDTLIVASSDLSHYHPYDDAVTIDHKTLNAVEEWDYYNMSLNFEDRVWEACGGGGIVAAMIAAERLGANRAQVLRYANSGDVIGDKNRVVGYGAVGIFKDPSPPRAKAAEFKLGAREKRALLEIARMSVETAVRERKLYDCSPEGLDALARDRGAFVTLREKGELRGCIGNIGARKPLCMTVRDVAAYAALRDTRFRPVTLGELNSLDYEVSVLSPLHRVTDWAQIHVGRNGLLVRKGDYQGVLLPQVPVEEHWNRDTFLDQTCVKAGLSPRCWKDDDTDVFMFTADVFGQHQLMDLLTPDEVDAAKPRGMPSQQPPGSPPQ